MKPFLMVLSLAAFVVETSGAAPTAGAEWTPLFDGKTLAGWIQRNGTARYEVAEGAIVGTTAKGSPNSFLCTEKEYGDFVLELEFKVDEGLNSGVQIRSQSRSEYRDGRVHGYQVEIDPAREEPYAKHPPNLRASGEAVPAGAEPRSWTGGIYDEARRGWLCDLTHNEAARKAFKPGEWNQFRIEAMGDSVRTWLNGVYAAGIVDSLTPNGFIALQVHATEEEKPMQVRWRNIRIQDLGANDAEPDPVDPTIGSWETADGGHLVEVFRSEEGGLHAQVYEVSGGKQEPVAAMTGQRGSREIEFAGDAWKGSLADGRLELTHEATSLSCRRDSRQVPGLNAPPPSGAVVLFDGDDVDAWLSQAPREWEASDGPADDWLLIPGGRLEAVPGKGPIITKEKFGDCRLHAEFRTVGPVNSGVYLQARYEISLKDSYGAGKGSPCGAPGNFSGKGEPPSIANVARPPYEWQTLDVDFRAPRFDSNGEEKQENARITVVMNGRELYRDFEVTGIRGAAKRLGEAAVGPVMLQEHGSPIQFRNIWIVEQLPLPAH